MLQGLWGRRGPAVMLESDIGKGRAHAPARRRGVEFTLGTVNPTARRRAKGAARFGFTLVCAPADPRPVAPGRTS